MTKRINRTFLLAAYGVIGSFTLMLIVNHKAIRHDLTLGFYQAGIKYRELGWPLGATNCLDLAAFIGSGTPDGANAARYRWTSLPRYPMPKEAVELNIMGYHYLHGNYVKKDLDRAEMVFKECIRRYPNFEWPWNNLASVYVERGLYQEAEQCSLQSLKINERNITALVGLATAKHYQRDFATSRSYIARALALDPDSTYANDWQSWLEQDEARLSAAK